MSQVSNYLEQLKEKGVEISFNHVGKGDRTIFTFAGVGMDERYFTKYFTTEENKHQFFHFYIKVHNHKFKKEIPELWCLLAESLIDEYQVKEFDIIAYSIGCRLSYPLLNQPKLDNITLICPDGIFKHPVYSFATQTMIGGILFYPIFSTIRFLFSALARYIKLSPHELFKLWKLYSVFKFPKHVNLKLHIYLASKDYICPASYVVKTLRKSGNHDYEIIVANHFSILSIIKKNILLRLK